MNYQALMAAMDMIWDEKPRLDIRACRDEAYTLLDAVLEDFTDYIWIALNEDLGEMLDQMKEDDVEVVVDAVADAVGFGVDLYLAENLAAKGKLTATGGKKASTETVFAAMEQKELHVSIIERSDLTPIILRDYSIDLMESLSEEITSLGDFTWSLVNNLRQMLLSAATTSFVFTAIHLEDLYGVYPGGKKR